MISERNKVFFFWVSFIDLDRNPHDFWFGDVEIIIIFSNNFAKEIV